MNNAWLAPLTAAMVESIQDDDLFFSIQAHSHANLEIAQRQSYAATSRRLTLHNLVRLNLAVGQLHAKRFILPPRTLKDVTESFGLTICGYALWLPKLLDDLLFGHANRNYAWVSRFDVPTRCGTTDHAESENE